MTDTPPRCTTCNLDKTLRKDGVYVCVCCEIKGQYPCGHAAETKRETYRL